MRHISGSLERKSIAVFAVILGLYNLTLTIFRRPIFGMDELQDIVPQDVMRGGRLILIIAALTLFAIAPALWHGKRAAWLFAVICGIACVVAHPLRHHVDVWGTAISFGFVGTLLGARPQFPARSDPPTALRGVLTLLIGMTAIFIYSVAGLYFLDRDFRHGVSFSNSLKDGARLLFVVFSLGSEPVTRHGRIFLDSIRAAVIFVWFAGALQILRPVVYRLRTQPHEREQVRKILEQYGDSALAFFALLPDKSYFFSDSETAVIAYGVAGDTAMVLGDPLGDPAEFKELIAAFQQHCQLNGWAYAFTQARPQYLALYESLGLKVLKTGEEGVVAVADFTLAGQAAKHLRATMNRFEREGYVAEVLQPPHPPEVMARLRFISDDWLQQGHRRERRFSLGYFDEGVLQQCPIMVAKNSAGDVVAFANIIPSYTSREGTFDMLRYGEEPKAVADFIYIALIRYFKEQGFTGMNLGLAPFSGLNDATSDSAASHAMRLLYRYGGFLLRYQGLREFKAKFTSDWQPRYLVYPSDAQLPGIALATMRIGEMPRGLHLKSQDAEPANNRWEEAAGAI